MERLGIFGKQFLKKGKGDEDIGDVEAYKKRWHLNEEEKVVTVSEILDGLGSPMLTDVYADLSCWVHWNARGLGSALKRQDDRIRVDFDSPEYGNWAMVAGVVSALQTAQLLDDHLDLALTGEIESVRDALLSDLGKGRS